jgi:hypothetical protein
MQMITHIIIEDESVTLAKQEVPHHLHEVGRNPQVDMWL